MTSVLAFSLFSTEFISDGYITHDQLTQTAYQRTIFACQEANAKLTKEGDHGVFTIYILIPESSMEIMITSHLLSRDNNGTVDC